MKVLMTSAACALLWLVMGTGTALGQPLYLTSVNSNTIWVGSRDGSAPPKPLVESAVPDGGRPTAIIAVGGAVQKLFVGAGGAPEIRVTDLLSPGPTAELWRDAGQEHVGLTADPFSSKLYWTTQFAGRIYAGAWDGSGDVDVIIQGLQAPPSGITLDPGSRTLFWTATFHNGIFSAGVSGRPVPRLLYGGRDAVSGARQIVFHNNRLYWTEHAKLSPRQLERVGRIRTAPADGSGPVTVFYQAPQEYLPWGIDIHGSTLYWTEFHRSFLVSDDRVMIQPLDRSVPPEIMYSGDFGGLRGVAVGSNIVTPTLPPQRAIAIHHASDLTLACIVLLIVLAAKPYIRVQRRR